MRTADVLCDCKEGHKPGAPWYYTSAMNDKGQRILLSGPYPNHPAARAAVRADVVWVQDIVRDPRAPWYAYGTAVSYSSKQKTARVASSRAK